MQNPERSANLQQFWVTHVRGGQEFPLGFSILGLGEGRGMFAQDCVIIF